jgi:hypothetical protein
VRGGEARQGLQGHAVGGFGLFAAAQLRQHRAPVEGGDVAQRALAVRVYASAGASVISRPVS